MIYSDPIDPGELRAYATALNRRAFMLGISGKVTERELLARILQAGGRCEWCDISLVGREFEVDHVLSLSRQGEHMANNLAICCPECNRRKSDKHPSRFAAEQLRRNGTRTALILRVLKLYDGDVATQLSLFEENSSQSTGDDSDQAEEEPPIYRW